MTENLLNNRITLFTLLLLFVPIIVGCSSSKQTIVYLNCTNEDIELFSDGEYLGVGGPIPFTIKDNQQSIEIEGRKKSNGQTVFINNYHAPFKQNSLIDIKYTEPLFYSN